MRFCSLLRYACFYNENERKGNKFNNLVKLNSEKQEGGGGFATFKNQNRKEGVDLSLFKTNAGTRPKKELQLA